MKIEGIFFGKRKMTKNVEKMNVEIEQYVEEDIGFKLTKDDTEISRINKKILDLSIHDSEDRTGSKQEYKFRLPEGAEKLERVGYEEVLIPASQKVVNEILI